MISVLLIVLSLFSHSGDSLKHELDGYLRKNLSGYKDFQYEIVQMPANFKKASIIKTNDLNINGSLAYVPVNITTQNNRSAKSFITIRLKLFRDVLVAVRSIKFREILTAADFKFENKDVAQVRGTPVLSLKDINELRSKLTIKEGDVLIEEAVEQKPIINVGDQLKASVKFGNVYVSTEATARQEGRAGDIIQVVTKDKKQFKAKVIDSNNVLIVE